VGQSLFIYCAGGFGKEVLDIARRLNRAHALWHQIAFLDDTRPESTYCGADVFCLESARERFGFENITAIIASGEPFVRKALLEKLEDANVRLATLIDTSAVISESAVIGDGSIISPFCFVSSMATVGRNVALVAGAAVGHDTLIGDNCVISGQVNLGGGCVVGSESYIGMGTQVKQETRIGQSAIVGMGSAVFANIPDNVIAMGNPCRPLRPNISQRIFG
jgi:sugar O-acyltransferase (sialic acid O-acetyltransferase NeuD family)